MLQLQNQNIFCTDNAHAEILTFVKVTGYKADVLHGSQKLSGSDLKGKARQYKASYMKQIAALKAEIESFGYIVERTTYREIGLTTNQCVWKIY